MLLRKYAYFFDIFRQISTAIYITFTKCRIFVEKRVKKWSKSLKLALFCVIFSEKILSFFETFTGLLRGLRSVGSGDPTALACDPLIAHLCGSAVDSSLCNSAISTHKSALYKSLGRRLCELFEKIDTLKLRITSVIH